MQVIYTRFRRSASLIYTRFQRIEKKNKEAEQGGQPERRLARFLNSMSVTAARLPLTLGLTC